MSNVNISNEREIIDMAFLRIREERGEEFMQLVSVIVSGVMVRRIATHALESESQREAVTSYVTHITSLLSRAMPSVDFNEAGDAAAAVLDLLKGLEKGPESVRVAQTKAEIGKGSGVDEETLTGALNASQDVDGRLHYVANAIWQAINDEAEVMGEQDQLSYALMHPRGMEFAVPGHLLVELFDLVGVEYRKGRFPTN